MGGKVIQTTLIIFHSPHTEYNEGRLNDFTARG
jgi:hypothetical protein